MSIRTRVSGFTMIELMIAIAILGIIAAIVYPAYRDYEEKQRLETTVPPGSSSTLEIALQKMPPNACYFGVSVGRHSRNYVGGEEIAGFLNNHPELELVPTAAVATGYPLFKKKNCGELR